MNADAIDKLIKKVTDLIDFKENRYKKLHEIHALIDAVRERQQISQLEDVLIYANEYRKEQEMNFEKALDLVQGIHDLTIMQSSTVCRDIHNRCDEFFKSVER